MTWNVVIGSATFGNYIVEVNLCVFGTKRSYILYTIKHSRTVGKCK